MSTPVKIITIAAIGMLSSIALNTNAQDRQVLSGKSGGVSARVVTPKAYRTDDRGRSLQAWRDQVVYRKLNNTNVYQYRGKATARHDEVSSHGIIFRTSCGSVKPGHAYHRRGN